jgi:hypothetical protein
MNTGFEATSGMKQIGTFSEASFSGFVVSGKSYTSELCFGDVNCKFVTLYAADTISGDNWLYGQDATYGVIGMGPQSFIWDGFVNPISNKAVYSIELGRIPFFSDDMVGAEPYTKQSNITFGSPNNDNYIGKDSVYMTALSNYSYGVNSFSFGKVYYDDNNQSSSAYWYELGNTYPIEFTTNVKGLGLPANLYTQFVTLLEYITSAQVHCDNSVGGYCYLPQSCDSYAGLEDFAFEVQF